MPPRPPVHPEFVAALRLLARAGVPNADAWRMLRPTAERLGVPRPSYFSVRRIMAPERIRHRRRRERTERIVADLLAGLIPKV